MPAKTQEDLVQERMGYKPAQVTRKIALPGIKTLHTKSTADIAEALTMILKAEANIVELRYKVGEFIEVTCEPLNPY